MKATQTIWRTVVFAGAMLGAPACHKNKPATTTPTTNTQPTTDTKASGEQTPPSTDTANQTPPATDGNGDPCNGGERPRGTDENGGGTGRGFVLS